MLPIAAPTTMLDAAVFAHILMRSPSLTVNVLSARGEKWPTMLQQKQQKQLQEYLIAVSGKNTTIRTRNCAGIL